MSKIEAINRLLNPSSIAIVGVSKDFTSISGKPMKNLLSHQYKGKIYPVNPKYNDIEGIQCYPSILEIPGEVDVALIAVSSKRMLQILDDCKEKGVHHLVLFGSGFAEVGEEGMALQEKVLAKAQQAGIHILGPNCVGLLNVKDGIPMGFATSFETKVGFNAGNVGFASQSGAIGFSLFGLAQEENIGFSYIVNTGNQMDIHSLDCIEYMLEDVETKVVAGYLEGIPDGELLIKISESSKQLNKPVILLKAGRSELGQQAALSHTASLTGSDEAFRAVAKQFGLITVNDVDDMIDAMKVFSRGKRAKGNRIVTISNSGAAGIAMADYSEELGLNMVPLSSNTGEKVKKLIPPYGSALNPIDVTAQALKEQHILTETLEILIDDDEVDAIVFQTTFGGELGFKICQQIIDIDQKTDKPILVTITGTQELTGKGREVLQKAGVPVYATSYKTMLALKHLVNYSHFVKNGVSNERLIPEITALQLEDVQGVWTEVRVKEELTKLSVRVPEGKMIKDQSQLSEIKEALNYPVVCKVISEDVLHKTDAGGVKVNIQNAQQLQQAYEDILQSVHAYNPTARIEGVLAEEMILDDALEMFIGVKDDPQFGSLIVCGLGGIFIEVLKDVSIRKAPLDKGEALEMLKELKGYPLLEGVRGGSKRDISSLVDVLVRVSHFASSSNGKISEMDINPLWVFDEGMGVAALDGIIVWKENSQDPVSVRN
ncbi:acetate--CoA ligase family protein [Cytobacillus purgationiresistens]|uniref:Acyl-CoA synthetase (NDP forming) n=1 Tax=Cytobacillus purgationiresistens TaxID=863449 RepID=A0ABU0AEJ7_9BACI|nr:acetate--CoA ligase family protein [Cytobacillus purgationiresistens]MDQ0269671.1 acyl-CoA synthetase (NDP forming) [Cytobacillus purgationiresistens]